MTVEGTTAFRAWIQDLPAQIAAARERGQPVIVEEPETEHGRRLLQTLGVELTAPTVPIAARELVIRPEEVSQARRDLVARELQEARSRALTVMPLPRRCKACRIDVDRRTPGCRTCGIRHGWRAWDARRRAAS